VQAIAAIAAAPSRDTCRALQPSAQYVTVLRDDA